MCPTEPPRAATYVRMSTENQNYSTEHQRSKIRAYAVDHGLYIAREYVDEGKSGLDIKRRAGLLELIRNVQSGQADFEVVIVYDVSRWGRFQDIDEAAYHEHTCRRARINVVYCAEQFANEIGPYAALMKSIKRVMAAEYSRELSSKVFLAQSRFVEMGFKQGGHAGFGLRRLAIKACGTPRAYLGYRESKAALTDRVILVWGPQCEVETVRRIYTLYLEQKLSVLSITKILNGEQVRSEFGRPWTQHMLRSILTNVKYCGTLAYNRRSCKLSGARKRNPRDEWVINDAAIDPIISPQRFKEVQDERARRNNRYSHAELVQLLQNCHARHGKIGSNIIASDPAMPDPKLFVRAFGSLLHAYDAAGLPHRLTYTFATTKRAALCKRKQLFSIVKELACQANRIVVSAGAPFTLRFDELLLRIDVAICRTARRGQPNWKLMNTAGVDFVITARLALKTFDIIDYFLMGLDSGTEKPIYLRQANLHQYSRYQYLTAHSMFGITAGTDDGNSKLS